MLRYTHISILIKQTDRLDPALYAHFEGHETRPRARKLDMGKPDDHFEVGETYEPINVTGATYSRVMRAEYVALILREAPIQSYLVY